jgi:hypothetical protein
MIILISGKLVKIKPSVIPNLKSNCWLPVFCPCSVYRQTRYNAKIWLDRWWRFNEVILYQTLGKFPKFNRKIAERGKIDNTNTQIHDCSHSWLGTGTSRKKSGEVKLHLMGPNLSYKWHDADLIKLSACA